ncbi:MAG: VCBS repeat-containing protein [Gemmatimonadetes bacterium]|nr:VCBS repeat-containing protein [Gemmatimonadota bacterium]MYB60449.1 VCBS repeat-containing protein [Gemmatimonadota bacterium]
MLPIVVAVVAVFLAWDRGEASPARGAQGNAGDLDHANVAAAQSASYAFDRHEINIGPAVRQTVLTGFLLGGEVADLAVVKVDEDGGRRLRVYALEEEPDDGGPGMAEARSSPPADGTWALRMDTRLRSGVTFVDVARIGDLDRLITGEPGRLNVWDPDSGTEHELVSVANATAGFQAPREGEVPHVDVTRDANGDGRIDLVVPGDSGFQVYVQLESGTFADPVVVGHPPGLDPILGADGYRYDPWSVSRIHEFDFNGDGRIDLVSWNGDHFEAQVQDSQGLFGPQPLTFTTDVRFDTDEVTALAVGEMTGRALHSFDDLNGDSIADMVVYVLEGARIKDKRSAYEVHFGAHGVDGAGGPGGTLGTGDSGSGARGPDARGPGSPIRFASMPDVTIQTENQVQLVMERRDLDGDGEGDLIVTSIENKYLEGSLFKRIKGFMGDDVWLNLDFYHVRDGRIPDRATVMRRIQLDGAPSPREPGWVPLDVVLQGGKHARRRDREQYSRAFNKNLFIGDVTGNGRADLLIEWTHRELHVYEGIPGPGLFADVPRKVAIELPNDEEFAWMTDLNRDGRQDIVMHHPFTKRDAHGAPMELPGSESQRVTLLIAR